MPSVLSPNSADIIHRAFGPTKRRMMPAAAEFILSIKFSTSDKRRMNELLEALKDDLLTEDQASELENYRNAGYIIDVLHSQARQAMRNS